MIVKTSQALVSSSSVHQVVCLRSPLPSSRPLPSPVRVMLPGCPPPTPTPSTAGVWPPEAETLEISYIQTGPTLDTRVQQFGIDSASIYYIRIQRSCLVPSLVVTTNRSLVMVLWTSVPIAGEDNFFKGACRSPIIVYIHIIHDCIYRCKG